MKPTGEQLVPTESSQRLSEEHHARYAFAKMLCAGKCVLDIACGTGYGSKTLSEVAARVVGVDRCSEAISYARERFSGENLEFVLDDACNLSRFTDRTFDIVVSFETIEHLEARQRRQFLENVRRLLTDDGIFLLSTPNKLITSPFSARPQNPYHVIEFDRKGLLKELEPFRILEIHGQRFISTFFTWPLIRLGVRALEKVLHLDLGIYTTRSSCSVSQWTSKRLQPRIIVIRAGKK